MIDKGTAGTLQDLLQAAWALSDEQFEWLLQVPAGWLKAFRIHEVEPTPTVVDRINRLAIFHDTLRLWVPQRSYRSFWRRPWREGSPIGTRSLLAAYREDGDQVLDKVTQHFRQCRHDHTAADLGRDQRSSSR